MRLSIQLVIVLCWWVTCKAAWSLDLSLSPVLENARAVYQTKPQVTDYRLVKSSIKKVNNQWRASEEWVHGTLQRHTYILRDSLSFSEALVMLQNTIQNNREFQTVFTCQGLDCGSSNGWANQYLNIKQLYGLDHYQYYTVLQTPSAGKVDQIHVFYLIQRGNKRVYLQHDSVIASGGHAKAISNEEIQAQMLAQGTITVYSLVSSSALSQADVDELQRIVSLLNQNPLWVLRLVGHNFSGINLKQRTELSLTEALKLREQLLELGANPSQVTAHGVGALAPGQGVETRVELVLDLEK